MLKKARIWFVLVLVLLVAGGGLYFTGKLPFGPGDVVDVAAAETSCPATEAEADTDVLVMD